jgi:hypothetical protein
MEVIGTVKNYSPASANIRDAKDKLCRVVYNSTTELSPQNPIIQSKDVPVTLSRMREWF